MTSHMSAQDHLEVEAALAYNIEKGFQKRIGEAHAASPKPTHIEPATYVSTLPSWLQPYLKSRLGQPLDLETILGRCADLEGNIRNQQWHRARYIAAVACATQEAGGDIQYMMGQWGISASRAWFWASLARVFPPEYENAQMDSNRYHLIFQLAKLECGVKNRPRSKDQWDEISQTAVEMFEEYELWSVKQLKDALKERKNQTDPEVEVDRSEESNINSLSFSAYVDKHGKIKAVRNGQVEENLKVEDLLRNNGLTEQHVEIIFKPIGGKQERLV